MIRGLSWAKSGPEGRTGGALPGFFFVGGKRAGPSGAGAPQKRWESVRLLEFGRRRACLSVDYYIEHAFYIVYKEITKRRRMRLPAISCFVTQSAGVGGYIAAA